MSRFQRPARCQSFEEKIKQRNETARMISAATAKKTSQQFFSKTAPSNYWSWRGGGARTWQRGLPDISSQRKVLLSSPWPGRGRFPSFHSPTTSISVTKSTVTGKESLKSGMSENKTNLTQTPKNVFWEQFGLQHINSNQLLIAGRLKYFVKNWEMVTKDPWVHNTISGYQICFTNLPYQDTIPSMIVSVGDQVVIDKEIEEMIQKEAIGSVTSHHHKISFLSTLFAVPKKGGGQRPVFNLRQLNQFVRYEHFKMDGIHMLRDLLKPNDYMAKVDLKDAYFIQFPFGRSTKSSFAFFGKALNGSSCVCLLDWPVHHVFSPKS